MRGKLVAVLGVLAVAFALGVGSAKADQITLGDSCGPAGASVTISGTVNPSVTGSTFVCPDTSIFEATPTSNSIHDLAYTLAPSGNTASLDITCGGPLCSASDSLSGTITWASSGQQGSLDLLVGSLQVSAASGGLTEYSVDGTYEIDLTMAGCSTTEGGVTCTHPSSGQIPVPEPASMLLFGSGLATIAGVIRRKRRA